MCWPSASEPLPQPTAIERIVLPKGCAFIAYFIVGVDPPDPSERVNVYLPKSLIARVDRRAAELGMSRSSFSGSRSPPHWTAPGRCLAGFGEAAIEGSQDKRTA